MTTLALGPSWLDPNHLLDTFGIWALLQQVLIDDSGTNIDLASLEDTSTRTNSSSQDDPPPPPPEDQPDGADESGGTRLDYTIEFDPKIPNF